MKAGSHLFASSFPDNCRICDEPLQGFTRVPVCDSCLSNPPVFEAEFCCVLCRTPFLNAAPLDEEGRCRLCRLGVTQFNSAYAFAAYDGRVRELIHLFKYAGMKPLGRPLGRWLVRAYPREMRYDALVPVPLHWWRRFRRGYNQSELLARELSAHTGIPVVSALLRTRRSQTQTGLSQSQRRLNVRGIFAANPRVDSSARRLLLIDDVLTSGATANACAAALRRAGAARVDILTLARTDRRAPQGNSLFEVTNPVRGAFE